MDLRGALASYIEATAGVVRKGKAAPQEKLHDRDHNPLRISLAQAKEVCNREGNGDMKSAGIELFGYLGRKACKRFVRSDYYHGEKRILGPALKSRGFVTVQWYGLSGGRRGCDATTKRGELTRFWYA
jgi:hypothetical protein